MKVKAFSRVRLFATPWTAAYQASSSMGSLQGVPTSTPERGPLFSPSSLPGLHPALPRARTCVLSTSPDSQPPTPAPTSGCWLLPKKGAFSHAPPEFRRPSLRTSHSRLAERGRMQVVPRCSLSCPHSAPCPLLPSPMAQEDVHSDAANGLHCSCRVMVPFSVSCFRSNIPACHF